MLSTKVVDYAIIAICAGVAAYVKEQSGVTGPPSVLLPAVSALLVYMVMQLTVRHSERFWVVRYFLKPEFKYEGNWLKRSQVGDENLYGMFSMYFDPHAMKYQISGVAIRGDGSEYASWDSTSFQLETTLGTIIYNYNGLMVGRRSPVVGYCSLHFIRRLGEVQDGRGFFVDFDLPLRYDFEFERVDTTTVQKYLKDKSALSGKQDQIDFIRKFHELQHPTEQVLLENASRPTPVPVPSTVGPAGEGGQPAPVADRQVATDGSKKNGGTL